MKPSAKFKKACKNQGYDPDKIMPDFSMYPERHREVLAHIAELFIMADDANRHNDKNWDPDFDDMTERKYRPWVDMQKSKNNPSGFRFGAALCVFAFAAAGLGSRLSFRNEEIAQKFFENNQKHYKAIMTIPKTKKIK
jgi:hypothetical protein